MKSWKVRLLALLTMVATIVAVSVPAASAQTVNNCRGAGNTVTCDVTFDVNDAVFGSDFCGLGDFVNPVDSNEFGNLTGFDGCGGGFCSSFDNVAEEALAVALC